MKAEFSKICINPPYGAPTVGYYMPRFSALKPGGDDIIALGMKKLLNKR